MPYIRREIRDALDPEIEALARKIVDLTARDGDKVAFAGILNYACTRLAVKVMPEKRYWTIAMVTGVFKNIADEFYRRVGAPYEDRKMDEEGDVY